MSGKKIKIVILSSLIFVYLCQAQYQTDLQSGSTRDSLKIYHKDVLLNNKYTPQKFEWNSTLTLGTALMVSSGILSYYLDERADEYYSRYLKTGNFEKMDQYYDKAQKYDSFKGIAYIGIEIGFFINVWAMIRKHK